MTGVNVSPLFLTAKVMFDGIIFSPSLVKKLQISSVCQK